MHWKLFSFEVWPGGSSCDKLLVICLQLLRSILWIFVKIVVSQGFNHISKCLNLKMMCFYTKKNRFAIEIIVFTLIFQTYHWWLGFIAATLFVKQQKKPSKSHYIVNCDYHRIKKWVENLCRIRAQRGQMSFQRILMRANRMNCEVSRSFQPNSL